MEFKNCKSCGKLFRPVSRDICPSCLREDEEKFQTVKKYLAKHRNAGIQEVVDETKVASDDIIRYLREERLELKGGEGDLFLTCESCQAPISTGRFCKSCLKQLKDDIKEISPGPKQEISKKDQGVKFRIVDRYNKK